jgi:hypothetical protein
MRRAIPVQLLYVTVFALAVYGIERFCHSQTEGFAVGRICSSMPLPPDLEMAPTEPGTLSLVTTLLNQPFHYFAKGAQVYAFASEDGRYVIKCFRFDHLAPPPWTRWLRFPFSGERIRLEKMVKRLTGLYKDFNSYRIAFEAMPDETGLLYVHLNEQELRGVTLTLCDKLGIAHRLDASTMHFVVQKRADLVYPTLEKLLQKGDLHTAQAALSSLVRLLGTRYAKGIFDKDPNLRTNFGFLGEKAVQIDPGRFCFEVRPISAQEKREGLIRITEGLHNFMQERSPSLDDHLSQEIENLCAED